MNYADFLATKLATVPPTGLESVGGIHESLFSFQRDLVTWALRRGRAAIFCDTGLGKTRQQLEWAKHVTLHTRKPTLILAPLAVAAQTVAESERVAAYAKQVRSGQDVQEHMAVVGRSGIYVTNYDRLHLFDPSIYGAVVLDESSIIKNHDAKTLANLMDAFSDTPFRLCATATPSPNDYTELGTHAEFLGICSRNEMLAEFFVHDGGDTSKWRLKGHAKTSFWRWVSTWGALLRRPSDLGYDDSGYSLPPLNVHRRIIHADPDATKAQGLLFAEPAQTLTERRAARKGSIDERVRQCAQLVLDTPGTPWVIWCELNAEGDALEALIPGAVQISGADDIGLKERRLVGFGAGEYRVLITKPSIAGFGLNWQHCHKQAFVGVSDSFEKTYQAIRRSWRFGQSHEVDVYFFSSELEGAVVENYERKQRDAIRMAEELSVETRDAVRAEVAGQTRTRNAYQARTLTMPAWMTRREPDADAE